MLTIKVKKKGESIGANEDSEWTLPEIDIRWNKIYNLLPNSSPIWSLQSVNFTAYSISLFNKLIFLFFITGPAQLSGRKRFFSCNIVSCIKPNNSKEYE